MLSSAQAGHRLPYMQTPDNALLILGFSKTPNIPPGGNTKGNDGNYVDTGGFGNSRLMPVSPPPPILTSYVSKEAKAEPA